MTPAVSAKIRSHKFGRRRLTSNSAWCAYNKLINNEANSELIQAIASNVDVVAAVLNLNVYLKAALTAAGVGTNVEAGVIVVAAPDKMFIVRSVWMGYIDFPTGQLTPANRTLFQAAELSFADQAGKLRVAIASQMAAQAVLDDMGNVDQKPNKGGVVTGKKHVAANP